MLRRACDTAAMDDLSQRLASAASELESLRGEVVAGEPWPLSDAYGAEPESEWGPKEVLAHVAEMLPYWFGQIEAILAAAPPPADPPPFGRVATDAARIERIGSDRRLPAGELFDRIAAAATDAAARTEALTPAELERRGVHVRVGELNVGAIIERFALSHLEEHVVQLREIVARPR